jgi:hypothetical protein
MMLILCRIALAVVVLTLVGCDASGTRVYDDTTLRLTAYITPRPGEVLLEWTGGPSGYRRWEYSMSEYRLGPPEGWTDDEWRSVPRGTGRRLRLSGLETPLLSYVFKIRERGDPRDPAETNPQAVARGGVVHVRDDGTRIYWNRPLEPGERFWLYLYEVWVTAPAEGELVLGPFPTCDQNLELALTLPTADGEVRVTAYLWMWPFDSVRRERHAVAIAAPEALLAPAHERAGGGPTARESAEHAATPELRAAYGLLVQAIESMFGEYPPTASEQFEDAAAGAC